MKNHRSLKLFSILAAVMLLAASLPLGACEKTTTSEKALKNFFKKIDAGNYVISADGFAVTSVYSKDLIFIDYEDDYYYDTIIMTVNKDETFEASVDDGEMLEDTLNFYGEGHAIDVAADILPNYWELCGDGNIWNIFTDNPEEPLTYLIIDGDVREQIMEELAGMGYMFYSRMEDLYLTLDKENPTKANLHATFTEDEHAVLDDLDIEITFGAKKPKDLPSDSWVNDKNRKYPDAPTEWTIEDEVAFDVTFNQGYDYDELMPFPTFATYTFYRDPNSVMNYGQIWIRDKNASKKDMEDYIDVLLKNGFVNSIERLSDDTERECYHKQIEDFGNGFYAYSSVYVEYDKGINIITRKYFNHKDYEGLDVINALITDKGFLELSASPAFTQYKATDFTYEYMDSWANLFNYDLVMDVYLKYDDIDAAQDYLDAYIEKLSKAGYKNKDGAAIYSYDTELIENKVQYEWDKNNETLMLRFKCQRFLSDEEAESMLKAAGFPAIGLSRYDSHTKVVTGAYKVLYNLDHDMALTVNIAFDNGDDCLAFVDDYVGIKIMNDDFLQVDPMMVKIVRKNYAFWNEDKGLIVCFNYNMGESVFTMDMIKVGPDFEPLNYLG